MLPHYFAFCAEVQKKKKNKENKKENWVKKIGNAERQNQRVKRRQPRSEMNPIYEAKLWLTAQPTYLCLSVCICAVYLQVGSWYLCVCVRRFAACQSQ